MNRGLHDLMRLQANAARNRDLLRHVHVLVWVRRLTRGRRALLFERRRRRAGVVVSERRRSSGRGLSSSCE